MGSGEWSGRTQWPLAWVESVESLRVFGIFLTPKKKKKREEMRKKEIRRKQKKLRKIMKISRTLHSQNQMKKRRINL